MSYELIIENKYGNQLKLTDNPNYNAVVTGLSPVTSNIITTSVANYSGEKYITSRQQKRNIVLTIYVNEPVEANRINLYKYIKSDDFIRIYFKNSSRDVYIDGYVESFELDHFSQNQTAQVSIICPQPNFISKSENKVKNADVKDAFYFPFNTELSAGTANKMLEIIGLERAVINFNYFIAEPETIYVTPSPDKPVENSGLGEMSGSGYFAFLNFETAGRITNIKIPLDGKMTNANLVHGGADLIDENNYIVNTIYTDTDNTLYMDSDNNVLYE